MAIVYFSLAPNPMPDPFDPLFLPGADKIVHCIMYLGLMIAFCFDYYRGRRVDNERVTLVLAAVIALLLSGVIEVLQALMECGRSGEWLDWMANMTGIVVGVILGRKWGCEKILPFVSR